MRERKNIEILARFLAYFAVFACLCVYGITHTYALETKTIYSVNNNGTLASANTYNYGYLTGGGTQATSRANVNTTVNGVAYGFNFLFYENVVLNKTYTLVINFMDIDLLKTFNSSMVQISTCNGTTCNENTLVSVIKSSNTNNSNKLTIEFNPITTGAFILVNLGSDQPITGVSTFGIKSVTLDSTNQNQDIINNQTNNTNNIINNNNSNTQEIIENQNSSASAIMENQNQNTQDLIDSNKVCSYIDKNSIYTDNSLLGSSGTISNNNNFGVTNYINITNAELTLIVALNSATEMCFYNVNKDIISCIAQRDLSLNQVVPIPNNAVFARFTISKSNNRPQYKLCQNGNQANSNAINDLNDNIKDDDIGDATQDGADFILDFDTNTFGLTSIVTAPLNLIQSLTSSTCSELELPLPFLNNKKLKLPCMTSIYQNTFGSLFTMYQTITFGIIAYWVCVRIFNQVKDFKNPEHDEIEVVDL